MTLEEIKNAFVAEVEKLWHELTGTVDVDKARTVIADSAATLTGHVSALGQHLFDHVLGNAEQPTTEAAATVSVDPTTPATTTPSSSSGSPLSEDPSTTFGSEPSPQPSSTPSDEAPTQELAPVDETAPAASA